MIVCLRCRRQIPAIRYVTRIRDRRKKNINMNTQMGSSLPSEKLDRSNYSSWENKMNQFLVRQGHWSYNKTAQSHKGTKTRRRKTAQRHEGHKDAKAQNREESHEDTKPRRRKTAKVQNRTMPRKRKATKAQNRCWGSCGSCGEVAGTKDKGDLKNFL